MADPYEIANDWANRKIHGGGMSSEYAAKTLARALLAQRAVVEAADYHRTCQVALRRARSGVRANFRGEELRAADAKLAEAVRAYLAEKERNGA